MSSSNDSTYSPKSESSSGSSVSLLDEEDPYIYGSSSSSDWVSVEAGGDAMICRKDGLDDFVKKYKAGKESDASTNKMRQLWVQEMILRASVVPTPPPRGDAKKGRPVMDARKSGTKRDKTWEEHIDAKDKTLPKETKSKNPSSASSRKSRMGSGSNPSMASRSQENCTFVREVFPPPRVVQPSIVYLGLDWGSENIDSFMLAYISRVQDVMADGHCGYRAFSALLGCPEVMYTTMRFDMSKFIQKNPEYWQIVQEHPRDIGELLLEVNFIASPCSSRFWMRVPLMGLVFATMYQVVVVVLSWLGPCTCLPLFAPNGSEPPTMVVAMALVGSQNHFVPVWLVNDYCPIPPPPRKWRTYKLTSVDGWDEHPRFAPRFAAFMKERNVYGRSPIMN